MRQSDFKLRGTPSQALLGATIGFFFGVMAISLFGPTSTTLGAAMGLGATQLGLLVSVPSVLWLTAMAVAVVSSSCSLQLSWDWAH